MSLDDNDIRLLEASVSANSSTTSNTVGSTGSDRLKNWPKPVLQCDQTLKASDCSKIGYANSSMFSTIASANSLVATFSPPSIWRWMS